MNPITEQPDVLWPLFVYTAGTFGLIAMMLGLSAMLGGRHSSRLGNQPYESGVIPVGSARMRFSAKFYLVAIDFLLFDLEVIFIFAWAIAARELGWTGYIGVMIFISVLALALAYAWRTGTLDWAPQAPRSRALRAIENDRHRGAKARRA